MIFSCELTIEEFQLVFQGKFSVETDPPNFSVESHRKFRGPRPRKFFVNISVDHVSVDLPRNWENSVESPLIFSGFLFCSVQQEVQQAYNQTNGRNIEPQILSSLSP